MSIPIRCEFDHDQLVTKMDVTFSADPVNISPVVDNLMQHARKLACCDGKDFEIELSLREALANAIIHGSKGDAGKQVHCTVSCDEKHGILIVVRDSGDGFDPTRVPGCCQGENIYADHGRGIYLINRMMDAVEFKNGGTEIHMRKF
jgi:serine/threonine-protein kinase RsbW